MLLTFAATASAASVLVIESDTPASAIDLIDDTGSHHYVVNRLLIVPANGWQNFVSINDKSRSLLIVQTSHPDSSLRYLIEDFGATPQAPPVCRTTPLVIGNANLSTATTRFVAISRVMGKRTR